MTTFAGPALDELRGVGALTMGAFLEQVADRFQDNDALVLDDPLRGGDTVRWSYSDLRTEARSVGKALLALGVERGEPVAVLMGNRPEAVAAIFGAAMAGAVAVPVSTFSPVPELAHLLRTAEATVVLTQRSLLGRALGADARSLQDELPCLREVVVLGEESWEPFLAGGRAVDDRELDAVIATADPDDDALVIFSSGTTSAPKGVLHCHRAPSLQFWLQAQIYARHEGTRLWCALPIFWTAGLNTALGATLASGGCWVMQEVFEPGAALALMAREGVTEPYALPHQTGAMAEHPDWAATDLSSLRSVFGKSAFARHPSVQGDTDWFSPVGYGLSETCAFFAAHWSSTPRELQKQSMGQLLPGNLLRVVDPATGAALPAGEEGELAIKGPTLMRGYLGRRPEDCVDADGFFHTGDAGRVDADGYVHFAGRRTEMIKTGGANVSPAEVEVQLRACEPVKLARVVGVPDARLDEVVVACVVLKDGVEATAADIQTFLRERLAAYKVPKHVLFFEDGEIPMTASETKVRDEALLALVQQRLAAQPVPTTTGDR